MIQVIDNYLPQKEFGVIQRIMLGSGFTWHYNDRVVMPDGDEPYFQFTHTMVRADINEIKPSVEIVKPLAYKINPEKIMRIKCNLLTRHETTVTFPFHIDIEDFEGTTAIYYINTNNGVTKFEDGTVVESVANRLVTFPSKTKHTGTTCTDEKVRVVVNLNYV